MPIFLYREYFKDRILEVVTVFRISIDQLNKTLISAVLCPGIFTPSTPNTTLFTAGGADIMLSRFFVRYQIYTRYCGEFIIPFFVCGLIVDYGMQGIK